MRRADSLLEEVRVKQSCRVLVTILDEEPKTVARSQKENLRAVFAKMRGVEMFRKVEDVSEWQKALRDQ